MRKLFVFLAGFVFLSTQLFAQSRTITGKVTDAKDGAPLAGVSIVTQDGKSGVKTQADGGFSIAIPSASKALVFSYVGYTSQTITIGSSTSFTVQLKSEESNLSEVVVTSFGIRRDKKTLGYSTPVINSDELTSTRNSNISNALSGKAPGVRTQGTGGSFTGSSILIRGYTSMTGSSAPLFVVDGVPIDNSGGGVSLQNGTTTSNRVVDINPDDIESMTILKGAAATSLYGSRGAGGVILMTTKKGRKRVKDNVEVVSSYSMVEVNRLPEFQNTYAQGAGGLYVTNNASSWGPLIMGQTVTNYFGKSEQLAAYPNNVKDIFQKGYSAQNSISFSGGSDKTTYRLSYNNTQETYVLRNNKLSKNGLTLNLNSELTSKLTASAFLNYNNTASNRTQQGNQLSNPIFRAWFIPRSYDLTKLPYYDAAGNEWFYGSEDNPYWSMDNVRYNDETNRFFGNAGLKYKFNNWLNADLKVGADVFSFKAHGFDEIGIRGGGNTSSSGTGGVREVRNTVRNFNSYFTLNANQKFGSLNVAATLGNEIFDNYSNTSTVVGTSLSIKGFDQMKNATVFTPSFGTSQTRTIGFFGDVVVDYRNWLSLNVKARNDLPSTLPEATRSVFYPAAAVSVLLSEALPGIKSDFVNQVKLRANIGKVGRGPGAYNTDNYAVTGGASDGFGPSIAIPFNSLLAYTISNSAGNPKLKPEFTTEWEVGANVNLWNNRLIIEANYYQRKLTDGLFGVPVSPASGVTSVFQNAGEIETKGVELGLTLTPVKLRDFNWTINGNYTQFKSTVTKLAPGVSVITLGGFTTPNVRLVEGDEFGQIYGNKYQRDAQGRMILSASGLPLPTSSVFKIGNPNPKFTIGLTNTFSYKNFTLDVLVDIRSGGDIYSRDVKDLRSNGVAIETAALPRFDKDNVTLLKNYQFTGVDANGNAVNVPITAEQYWGNSGKYVAAEGFILNTSWVRVREMNLSYKLPKKLVDKSPFGAIEFGIYGQNLFLWAKDYPHFDPEQNLFGSSNFQGLQFNSNPSTRTMGVNLKLTF
ncbi:SusC/RagA family TonB-linked outer membrane protein [Asinibacterium sp. OR53]|uniref:SusC/RagA family TonB-linked outer membrane protein n=1 Tax=Asinibacterium sp. OR53 TaxID=925409 RepID=UPI0004B65B4A|nr:SusC/RagA family TonB-linked outer membrane protein [Asinibacterium sp. OR53]